jgi:hypothetical protein
LTKKKGNSPVDLRYNPFQGNTSFESGRPKDAVM